MVILTKKMSERTLSQSLGLSRNTIRKILSLDPSLRISSLKSAADYFNQTLAVLAYPKDNTPDCTSVAFGYRVERDGFDSWKIHLMDLVDEFRNTTDIRLFFLPPDKSCPHDLQALLAATILELCQEVSITPPEWPRKIKPLKKPWFVAGIESLKASALLESPVAFRSKNIFVHSNFLARA